MLDQGTHKDKKPSNYNNNKTSFAQEVKNFAASLCLTMDIDNMSFKKEIKVEHVDPTPIMGNNNSIEASNVDASIENPNQETLLNNNKRNRVNEICRNYNSNK